jgi:hypothetical protein
MNDRDAGVILAGLGVLILIVALSPRPGRWWDRAAGELDWLIDRIKTLWKRGDG